MRRIINKHLKSSLRKRTLFLFVCDKTSVILTISLKDKRDTKAYNFYIKEEVLMLEIIFDVIEETLVVELFGEIDHNQAAKGRDRIDHALDNYKTKNLIFDFSKVTFMDSSGIGMILGRYRKMGEKSGNMAIVCCSKMVRSIMNMSGVFSVIDYFDTREEALLFFGRKEVS